MSHLVRGVVKLLELFLRKLYLFLSFQHSHSARHQAHLNMVADVVMKDAELMDGKGCISDESDFYGI